MYFLRGTPRIFTSLLVCKLTILTPISRQNYCLDIPCSFNMCNVVWLQENPQTLQISQVRQIISGCSKRSEDQEITGLVEQSLFRIDSAMTCRHWEQVKKQAWRNKTQANKITMDRPADTSAQGTCAFLSPRQSAVQNRTCVGSH